MNPSAPFIERPIATALLMLAIFLSGLLAYQLLPISALPEVDYPTIRVVTYYPGASPEVSASYITAPLEKQFGQMPGLNQMTSNSSNGQSIITLQFTLSTSLDVAEQEVQAAINAATSYLPSDLPYPPVYSKVNPADPPIITLALSSNILPLTKVEDLADTRFAQKLSQLSGVGLVSLSGGQRPAVRIQVNPMATASLGLNLEDIRNSIVASNVNIAKGSFDGKAQAYIVNSNDQLLTSDSYRSLVIAYQNGAPVRLSDVARVFDGVENNQLAAWKNETPAVIMNIQRQPGSNVIQVVDRIRDLLPRLTSTLPRAVDVSILSDRTISIRASIQEAKIELILSVALVVLVIFLFLRNLPATIIPSIAVPLSLVGTLGAMYLLNFSLNNLTLMALIIATGFVVDDAIVMIENITRYIEQGESAKKAALKGARQIGFTIMSLTVSLIAVLIPLLFMTDVVGRLFRQFALTLSVTILISAFVSLTLTPMMCSRILRHKKESEMSPFEQKTGKWIQELIDGYGKSLTWVLQYQNLTLIVAVLTLFLTGLLFYLIPKGFFPTQDTGLIQGISDAPQSISFPAMMERQQALAKEILKDPAVLNLSSFIGIDGTNTTLNRGRMLIGLKPIDDRDDSAENIIRRLKKNLENVPGITLYMQPVQDITVDDRISLTQYQYSIGAVNINDVTHWSGILADSLKKNKVFQDVAVDTLNQGLQTNIYIDRDTASRLGLTPLIIDNTLYDAFGQRQISIIYTQLNQYRVVMEILPELKLTAKALDNIYINPETGTLSTSQTTTSITGTSSSSSARNISGSLALGLTQANNNSAALGFSRVNSVSLFSQPVMGVPVAANASSIPLLGNAIPLSTITKTSIGTGPVLINRQGQFPVATISFNLAKGASLGDAIKAINTEKEKHNIPRSIQANFEGSAKTFENSLSNEGWLLVAAIIVVYIILGILYESYIHPITILSTLPSATMGALIGLMLTNNELSVIALIGIILLIGIVMKNAILMIDFALELERLQGKSPQDAIYEAALLRFRPIVMTTLAAMLGAVPLALASGMGAELRRPLGIAIIAGLIVSQLLTLYTTPVIYLAFDRLSKWMVRGKKNRYHSDPYPMET